MSTEIRRTTLVTVARILLIGVIGMGLFSQFFGCREKKAPSEGSMSGSYPWDKHQSIYEHMKSHIQSGQEELADGWETLPDEERLASKSESKIRWAAGALDGVMGHHSSGSDSQQECKQALSLIQTYCHTPTVENKAKIYSFIMEHTAIHFIDPLMDEITKCPEIDDDRLYDLAHFLATESPDRDPVKVGVALLGMFQGSGNEELFHTLGRHDEFTLYCAVAIANSSENAEPELWRLAQQVEGWGRIHIVDRLSQTKDPQIKDWLLREGYKNSVMYEYSACTCASTGDLLAALNKDDVDQEMLTSAAEIIEALINGGPAEDMNDYKDGAAVVELYLNHMATKGTNLKQLLSLTAISRFLQNEQTTWDKLAKSGWTPKRRAAFSAQCSAIVAKPQWKDLVQKSLETKEPLEFWNASQAAKVLGIDTWEIQWRRLQEAPTDSARWYEVMTRCNDQRIDMVLTFAEEHLPLEKVATGPGDEMGLGLEYEPHTCLDYILQELGNYPGKGAVLVEAALKSPVTRNRNWATNVLSSWGKDSWPSNMKPALEQAVAREPEEDVRERMERVLAGKPLKDD